MDRLPIITVLVALAMPPLAVAQLPDVRPGERIRIDYARRVSPPRLRCAGVQRHELEEGRVISLDSGVLQVRGAYCDTVVAVPLADVEGIQVARGTRGNAASGAVIGGLAFGVLGAILGSQVEMEMCIGFGSCSYEKIGALPGFVIGAIPGAIVGAVAGALTRSDNWVMVPSRRAQPVIRPSHGGVSVGLRLDF